MMKTIVEEKPISFKELEQKIFSYVCELGREITTAMLEAYDKELAEGIRQNLRMERKPVCICWMKPCRWKR